MNWILVVLKFLVSGKELKIALIVLCTLIILPACGMVVIAASPALLLQNLFSVGATSADPAPTGIAILGDFTYPGDNYAPGNCTYWAYARRDQVGLTIPNTWGNAATWAPRALNDGYKVDHFPTQYAVMQTPNAAKGLGHVAFVESVDPDGTWHISEMNVEGLYIVDHKAMPASTAQNYNFIHTKE